LNQQRIKIGLLTSSRADYGIYKPLLKRLSKDIRFDLHILAFGTHLLDNYGTTISEIEHDNYGTILKISGMPQSDSLLEISRGYGEMVKVFAEFWFIHHFDWVIALGDRFEMSAAVQATIPFEVKIAHLHGGETTLGATDNIYRHQISLASKLHFVASEEFKEKVVRLTDETKQVYNVGALSLDDIEELVLPVWPKVCAEFNIPEVSFVLATFHPETIGSAKNEAYAKEVYKALEILSRKLHIVVTMSNADAMGSFYRDCMTQLKTTYPTRFSLIENFGRENYFAAMDACLFLLGNTSSGIAEAASFNKYVINVGDRQKGRLRSDNVKDILFDATSIVKAGLEVQQLGKYKGINRFFKPSTAANILDILAHA
jgi:GDP/UDP-N,N'-diacetylbacillosamine 2-epimerase (hydrolysing)